MRVLVACERSAVVRDSFRALGHDAWSCDLAECEGDEKWHLVGDALDCIVNPPMGCSWDALIAHPECRYLSSSGLHWNGRREGRAELTAKALEFVEQLWFSDIPLICLENPQGCINTKLPFMPKPQYIQPYQFGHDASKKTGLWLKGLPWLTIDPTQHIAPRIVEYKGKMVERWANQTDSGQNRLAPSPTRSRDRARTYEGIARAFAFQWGNLG